MLRAASARARAPACLPARMLNWLLDNEFVRYVCASGNLGRSTRRAKRFRRAFISTLIVARRGKGREGGGRGDPGSFPNDFEKRI